MTDGIPSPPTTIEPLDELGGRALVEAWRASGLSGAAYCRLHDLRPQRLHYWRERLGYPIRAVNERGYTAPERTPMTDGFVQVLVKPSSVEATTVDIVVGGATIRVMPGFDASLLRSVIGVLRAEG